jgi:hypothetical protein
VIDSKLRQTSTLKGTSDIQSSKHKHHMQKNAQLSKAKIVFVSKSRKQYEACGGVITIRRCNEGVIILTWEEVDLTWKKMQKGFGIITIDRAKR